MIEKEVDNYGQFAGLPAGEGVAFLLFWGIVILGIFIKEIVKMPYRGRWERERNNGMANDFFVVTQTYTDYATALRDDNQIIARRCRACGAIFSDRRFDRFRVHFSGKKEGDFYFAPICIIVSEKFLNVL